MPKPIIWSPLSEKDFESILEYLDDNWGDKVVNQFIEITEKLIDQISLNPRQFPIIHRKKKVRKCIITRHNALFYRDRKDYIDILRIYDSRQDPQKLKFQ
ncbi:type II toxin-antitoxin system RelE/ParE family toxin [Aquipluma nitroreducens]|uniref:type II toxin-antitoxin system RelE/ParE family toxin n=1 Tax=Aquipluma nitroreducens TaxID=2010828 RepID=UPI00296E6210|nr:type II toxin-antitoxin system RelE/ParE family toxin [Aquipluma nitroreducens]